MTLLKVAFAPRTYASHAIVGIKGINAEGYITNGMSAQEIQQLHYRPRINGNTW